jgi:hypothetical protein
MVRAKRPASQLTGLVYIGFIPVSLATRKLSSPFGLGYDMACSIKGNVERNTSPSTGRAGDFLDFQPPATQQVSEPLEPSESDNWRESFLFSSNRPQENRASPRSRNRQTEERATPGGAEMVHNLASANGRPVEGPVGVLDQSHGERAIAIARVQVVYRGQRTG